MIRWFLSPTVRHATDMKRQVAKLLAAQRDILKPQAIETIQGAIIEMEKALAAGVDKAALIEKMSALEKAANENLKPYPNSNARENVEVILVAIAVALAIRTFFLQPFKIPTGSMQPTLYGITSDILGPDVKIPSGWQGVKASLKGHSYIHEVAPEDGILDEVDTPINLGLVKLKSPLRLAFFGLVQKYTFNQKNHYLWFPPEYGTSGLLSRSGVRIGQRFAKGEDIFKIDVRTGDHLFVDRVTYNFRRPKRGEIIVFETKGIQYPGVDQDQFYIKRLVGLPGEKLAIGVDQHLRINGQRLDASTPHFENLYGFDPNVRNYFQGVEFYGKEGEYTGHFPIGLFASGQEYVVSPKRFVVMGDHTSNSLDSRYWGDFDQRSVMGKSAFVYWPLSERFGWSHR